jgi:condensin complex subunit 1
MGELDPKPYRDKLAELYEYVRGNLPANIREAHETALEEAKENGDDTDSLLQLEQATLTAAIAEASAVDSIDQANEKENEFRAKVHALRFAQSALDFIDQFEGASAAFQSMLLSANSSDVTEALRFFVKARHFKLPCAVSGIKQSLALMWSSEQNIKDEVLKAFVDVFIAVPGSEGSQPLSNQEIAYNLLVLAGSATVSELASIEEAIGRLVKEERIPAETFSILWSAVSKGSGNSRATAIHVLSMGASADRSIVDSKSRLKLLLDSALGDHTEETKDWGTARAAAIALQRIERAQVDQSCAKYLVLERIIEQLCAVARGDWCVDSSERDTLEWFSAAEQVIGALFIICPEPEVACSDIIRGMHSQTLGGIEVDQCHPLRLARFFHALGHIALKLLVYTEALSGSVRRATAKRTLKKQEDADKAKSGKKKSGKNDEEDQIEAELGMAAEAEAENERKVAEIAEQEIVGRGLISVFGPLLVRIVANEGGHFRSEVLMQTTTLALCKFMCVSSSFCEKHLPVLFSALANAPAQDTTMRANTVVALGDLAFRFPNEVEPYTQRLYACLRDKSIKVRRHTLMVLTHLILNDMVKVKGKVCEIAMCLRDIDQRIRDMSRLLFHELSKRSNNPVYNMLPDIISQLSQNSIAKEDFRAILTFLLGYIKKDQQNEMLVEKLIQRFPKCTSVSQQSDIAYCMAQLKVNDRSIKYLLDNFKLYKDALFDEEVKKSFLSILTKAKKVAKPELKQALEEWESKLNEHSELGIENQVAGEKASRAKAQASKRATRKKKKQLEAVEEPSDQEESEGDEDISVDDKENAPVRVTKSAPQELRNTRRARQART